MDFHDAPIHSAKPKTPGAQRVLENCNQPAVDEYVSLIQTGHRDAAIALMLREEGHWLSEAEAEEFADEVEANIP